MTTLGQHGAAPEAVEATYRRITWRLIPFLIICYISAFVDRSNIGIAKLQLSRDIGLTEAMYGLGGGLFYLGYSMLEVPSNLMMVRIGPRATIARVMLLWSLCSAATAFIIAPAHFYILRFLLGAAEAGFFPGVLFYLGQWVPARRRARFTALFMSSMALSGVISSPISGLIMHNMGGLAGLKGWQWLFLIEGLPGCLLAAAALYCLTDRPDQARWLTPAQKAIVLADLEADAADKRVGSHTSFVGALKDGRFYVLALMSMGMIAGVGGLALWVPTVIQRTGVTNVWHVGLLAAVPYICGVAAQQLVAWSSDRRGERRWHAAGPALVAAAAWCLLPVVKDSTWLSLAVVTVVSMGMFGATGPFWSAPSNYLRGTAAAGGIALITTAGAVAGFFSPILVGWLTDVTGQLAAGQYYFGGLLAVGALALLLGLRSRAVADSAPLASTTPIVGEHP
ncbi:MAG TPA: MFS transporter [Caulobacteraceae bacterium]|jgi:D-galactonate transporter|nr:MFS transporter [Caulobacteraceae bacterium]